MALRILRVHSTTSIDVVVYKMVLAQAMDRIRIRAEHSLETLVQIGPQAKQGAKRLS